MCAADEAPACISHCASLPSEAQLVAGAICALDPCVFATEQPADVFLCPDNYACIGDGFKKGLGKCTQTDAVLLAGCNLGPTEEVCAEGTYCRVFDATFRRPRRIPETFGGMCMPMVLDGALCNTTTLRCEPGTTCTADPITSANDRCQRRCNDIGDCPCDSNFTVLAAAPGCYSLPNNPCEGCTAGERCGAARGGLCGAVGDPVVDGCCDFFEPSTGWTRKGCCTRDFELINLCWLPI